MNANLIMHPEQIQSVLDYAWDRILKGIMFFYFRLREAVDIPFPPASLPGENPHKRTGNLQKKIFYEVHEDELSARVGSAALSPRGAPYDKFLEYGTHTRRGSWKMKPRPWFWETWETIKDRVAEIMSTGPV